MKARYFIIIASIATVLVGSIVTMEFFTNQDLYDMISSYERIDDVNDSKSLEKLKKIPEINEFLAKHVNTNKVIFIETDPAYTTLHASGGYTGEYLRIVYFFEEPLFITYGCWTDSPAPDLMFDEDIIQHIKDDSCLDHFL